jgi:hypothetical protein
VAIAANNFAFGGIGAAEVQRFEVRAVDPAGNADRSAARDRFKIVD